jgi:hypothetical protein
MRGELGITVWCSQGESELEAAFSFCFFKWNGMMKAQEDSVCRIGVPERERQFKKLNLYTICATILLHVN